MVLFAVKLQATVEVFVSDSVLQNMYNNNSRCCRRCRCCRRRRRRCCF